MVETEVCVLYIQGFMGIYRALHGFEGFTSQGFAEEAAAYLF